MTTSRLIKDVSAPNMDIVIDRAKPESPYLEMFAVFRQEKSQTA